MFVGFAPGLAADPDRQVSNRSVIEEVVVVGRRPGPPLWKVEHNGHVLWLFGLVDPVPAKLEWDEASVAHLLTESGALLMPPAVSASVPSSQTTTVMFESGHLSPGIPSAARETERSESL